MTTFKAHFDGTAFVPDEPVRFPKGKPLTLCVMDRLAPGDSITGEELAKSEFAGLWADRTDVGDALEFARKLRQEAESRGRNGT